jgi:hypothetical protein
MVHSSDVEHAPIAELLPELDRLAVDAMADWKVPGAAIAVVQDGKIALAKAYGQRDIEADLPVTTAMQFMIGSITKSFTATGVALLHNEGRLDWTKPVRDYLPEFRLHDPVATERVTVGDLLCHQSGLPRHDWVWLPGDRTSAELLGVMRYLEPRACFGPIESRIPRGLWMGESVGIDSILWGAERCRRHILRISAGESSHGLRAALRGVRRPNSLRSALVQRSNG